jgi:STE24 endopeptidase
MSGTAMAIYAAIALSAALGVYLRARHIAHIARHRDAAPQAFEKEITSDDHRRAADYTIARTRFSIFERLYDAALSYVFILFLLAPLHALAASLASEGPLRSAALVALFTGAALLVSLPVDFAQTFGLEARFGFNRMSVADFFVDQLKSTALEAAIGVPALLALFYVLGAFPQTWWLFCWVGFLALAVAMTVIYPSVIAPLFNAFSPLPEGELKHRLLALLEKCGFESRGLFVMDASRRSTRGNAYFTGFGRAKRIVFFDTLLEKHGPAEIEAILAHELGHFKFGHVRQMLLMMAALSFLGFAALALALAPSGLAAAFHLPDDPGVSLALAMIVKDPVLHLLSPLFAWRSRRAEFEADDFARRMVGGEALVGALTKLSRDNLATLTPDPLFAAFYYTHPPAPLRIAQLER